MEVKKIAILTAGGLAPCLSSAVAGLIQRYTEIVPEVEILCYVDGYKGLLQGNSSKVTPRIRERASLLHRYGGSPIGNSRVKLTNAEDCVKRGLIEAGQDPLEVAAEQLVKDRIDVLHTIGGDDTSLTAADLARFLSERNYELEVIGLPKTIDNDVVPIRQTLGAATAAEQGARFFENVVHEHGANPRMLIVHEIMGRHCGWLAAATAREYRRRLAGKEFLPEIGLHREQFDVHAVFVPEMHIDLHAEADRLHAVMDKYNCAHIFLSEGACADSIVEEMEADGEEVPRDAFGHVRLDAVNPGAWFGQRFADMMTAEKTLVQKSGYFARAAPANPEDLRLIQSVVDTAVQSALENKPGLVGHDEERGGVLRAIEFDRIKGGKAFDTGAPWFRQLLKEIGQG